MNTTRHSRLQRERLIMTLQICGICVIAACIGFYLVEYISVKERPALGRTFHVVTGFALMCGAGILMFETLRKFLIPKKKKKSKRPPVFLHQDKPEDRDKPKI